MSGRGQQSVSKQPPAEFSQDTKQDSHWSASQPSLKPPSVLSLVLHIPDSVPDWSVAHKNLFVVFELN